MPFTQDDYVKASAIVIEATLMSGLRRSYPELTEQDRRQLMINTLDYVVRLHGFETRPAVRMMAEDEGE